MVVSASQAADDPLWQESVWYRAYHSLGTQGMFASLFVIENASNLRVNAFKALV